jgi:hypothetical protein
MSRIRQLSENDFFRQIEHLTHSNLHLNAMMAAAEYFEEDALLEKAESMFMEESALGYSSPEALKRQSVLRNELIDAVKTSRGDAVAKRLYAHF